MTDASANQKDPDANVNALEEWKMARSVFSTFDGYVHDLRKYGFTVLAALFTVDALQKLTVTSTDSAGKITSIGESTRLGLIIITIVFIVVLRFLEHDYQQFLQAASVRAKILERILNIELTETIAGRYHIQFLEYCILALYCGFIVIALIIGDIIFTEAGSMKIAILFGIMGILFLCLIQFLPQLTVRIHHEITHYMKNFPDAYKAVYLENLHSDGLFAGLKKKLLMVFSNGITILPAEDWIIDKISCKVGEKVRITVTNLDGSKPIYFAESLGVPVKIFKEGERGLEEIYGAQVSPDIQNNCLRINRKGNFSWFWDTTGGDLHTVYRIWPRGWSEPLRRSVVLYEKPVDASKDLLHA